MSFLAYAEETTRVPLHPVWVIAVGLTNQHVVDIGQIDSCQSALCDADPGVHEWVRPDEWARRNSPHCKRCEALLAQEKTGGK